MSAQNRRHCELEAAAAPDTDDGDDGADLDRLDAEAADVRAAEAAMSEAWGGPWPTDAEILAYETELERRRAS